MSLSLTLRVVIWCSVACISQASSAASSCDGDQCGSEDTASLLQSRWHASKSSEHPDEDALGRCHAKPLKKSAAIKALEDLDLVMFGFTITFFDACGDFAFQHTRGRAYCTSVDCQTHEKDGWTPDTQYGSFSNSKAVSSAVFLAAVVERGLATLDTPLKQLLPDIFHEPSAYADVTPRNIFSQTSGWTDDKWATKCFQTFNHLPNPFYEKVTNVSLEECVRQLSELPPVAPPDVQFLYTDNAWDVIALVVERRAGMNFETAFQKYLGKPLKMEHSSYVCEVAGSTARHAHPADGLCTTANDYSKFVQMMYRRGALPCGKRVLRKSSVREILAKQTRHAKLYDDNLGGLFTAAFLDTPCVTNLLAGNASTYGYGLGAMRNWGYTAEAWLHPGSLSSLWWIVPGKYSAYFSTAIPLIVGTRLPVPIVAAFEAQNYPNDEMCPFATVMVPEKSSSALSLTAGLFEVKPGQALSPNYEELVHNITAKWTKKCMDQPLLFRLLR